MGDSEDINGIGVGVFTSDRNSNPVDFHFYFLRQTFIIMSYYVGIIAADTGLFPS